MNGNFRRSSLLKRFHTLKEENMHYGVVTTHWKERLLDSSFLSNRWAVDRYVDGVFPQ
jgi:hypothetical protein